VAREKSKKKFADKNTPRIFAVRFEKKAIVLQKFWLKEEEKNLQNLAEKFG